MSGKYHLLILWALLMISIGTTGIPKGVDVMHKNATNPEYLDSFLDKQRDSIGILTVVCMAPGIHHDVSQLMKVSFNMAAWEICRQHGQRCHAVPQRQDL